MQDDLQKAYTAYQQALYLLPNPKVYIYFFLAVSLNQPIFRRIPNYGMVSVSSTIDMVPSTMPKKLSRPFFVCAKVGLGSSSLHLSSYLRSIVKN
jgi:hypothetical protein